MNNNIYYVKICDFILKNPKKSTKKCKEELLDILKLNDSSELDVIIAQMLFKQILKEKKARWKGFFYTVYTVDLNKLN